MAFSLPTSIDTSSDFISALTAQATVKLPRVPQQFASSAELAAAVVTQRANIDLGLPVWTAGQAISVATEWPATRRWFVGSTGALSHARECQLPGGKVTMLASDTAAVSPTTIAPLVGDGANGDVRFNSAAGLYYTKTAGAWVATGSAGLAAAQQTELSGLLSGATVTYTYNGSSQIATAAVAGGRTFNYAYTATTMTVTASDGAWVHYTLDGSGRATNVQASPNF